LEAALLPDTTSDEFRSRRCIVIGGGPAGLTCALYLARFNVPVCVVYREDQRARLIPKTHNFPGFPEGIRGDDLIERLKSHVAELEVELVNGIVERVEGGMGEFDVHLTDSRVFRGSHLVFATGVEDLPPDFPRVDKYAGRGLRYCAICDGYEANNLRIALIGTGDDLASHALFMRRFSNRITMLFNGEGSWDEIDPDRRRRLEERDIRYVESRITQVMDEGAEIRGFRFEDGCEIEVDRVYGSRGLRPRSEVARALGVQVNDKGFIKVDDKGRTNIEGVYAVGDVVSADYAQIVIGMGQAAIAAIDMHASYMCED
jgi:thioredoxin reductase (NADPH)